MLKLNPKLLLCGRFARREDGAIALETAIILPAMFFAYLAMFSMFDAYRQHALHQKAAYTLSDMISRETVPMDDDYLDGAHALFDTLTRHEQDSAIRVTVLRYELADTSMTLQWSNARGPASALTAAEVLDWDTRLPMMVDQEHIIVVETWAKYDTPFDVGMGEFDIHNFVFTRPRYAPQVLWVGL